MYVTRPLARALDRLPTALQRVWRASLNRYHLTTVPESFAETVEEVRAHVDPVLRDVPDLVRWDLSVDESERGR